MLRTQFRQLSRTGSQSWQLLMATSSSGTGQKRFLSDSSKMGFLENFFARQKGKILKSAAVTSEPAALEYIKTMVAANPSEVKTFVERGWNDRTLPFNDTFIHHYLTAIRNMGKLQSLNLAALLGMYQNLMGLDKEAANIRMTAALKRVSQPSEGVFSMGPVAGPAFAAQQGYDVQAFSRIGDGAGSTPRNPLYVVSTTHTGWKHNAGKILIFSLCSFIAYIMIMSFVDEKLGGSGGTPGAPGGGGGGLNPFSRMNSGSAVHPVEKSDKTFEDVVGVDEAKQDLQEIVLYLKDPNRFTRLGGKLPKGVLLTGPPGTGKTLLARAIAGEAGVPFFHASGSEFEEMFVGVGAKRVRELFEVAKSKAPCIIFIDEIDAIGGSRHLKDQSAMKMTLNQLLVEMDGFQQNNGVIVIAATNFPDSLDSALVRPGRFDKHVEVSMPDVGGRKAILEFYGKKIPLDRDVDLEQVARGTPGFSGAELFNLMNTAALRASVDNLSAVNMHALEQAKDKIMMGAERKSAVISPETLRMTAYHEAGHALVALKTDGADPIHKATIMPRGRALGMVMQLPDGDQTSMSRKQMLARLDVCMGGRVAEELVYGAMQVTSGAMSDLQQATRLARAMVMKYGLSETLGVRFIDENEQKFLSPELQQEIDKEVKQLLDMSYQRAKTILEKHRRDLEVIAQGLLEYESLAGGEIVDLLQGKTVTHGVRRSQKPSRQAKELTHIQQAIGSSSSTSSAAKNATPANKVAPVKATDKSGDKATSGNSSSSNSGDTTRNSSDTNSSESKIGHRGPPGKSV